MTQTIRTEFPGFDDVPTFEFLAKVLAPFGFEDSSWHNDSCPSMTFWTDDTGDIYVRLYVDFANEESRDIPDIGRFGVVVCSDGLSAIPVYTGDNMTEALNVAIDAAKEYGGNAK